MNTKRRMFLMWRLALVSSLAVLLFWLSAAVVNDGASYATQKPTFLQGVTVNRAWDFLMCALIVPLLVLAITSRKIKQQDVGVPICLGLIWGVLFFILNQFKFTSVQADFSVALAGIAAWGIVGSAVMYFADELTGFIVAVTAPLTLSLCYGLWHGVCEGMMALPITIGAAEISALMALILATFARAACTRAPYDAVWRWALAKDKATAKEVKETDAFGIPVEETNSHSL